MRKVVVAHGIANFLDGAVGAAEQMLGLSDADGGQTLGDGLTDAKPGNAGGGDGTLPYVVFGGDVGNVVGGGPQQKLLGRHRRLAD